MHEVMSEEIVSRQEAFTMCFVETINAQISGSFLWDEYEMGVREGIRQVTSHLETKEYMR